MEFLSDYELLPMSGSNWEHWNTKDDALILRLNVSSPSYTSFEREIGKFKMGEPSQNTQTSFKKFHFRSKCQKIQNLFFIVKASQNPVESFKQNNNSY